MYRFFSSIKFQLSTFRPRFPFAACVLLSLVSLGLVGCDREARSLSRAQASLERGNYEEAQEQLRGLDGKLAVELRGQAAAAQARREAGLAEIDRILELAPGPPRAELERLLRQGPGRIDDRRIAESIDAARSLLLDKYAEARANGMKWLPVNGKSSSSMLEEGSTPALALQLIPDNPTPAVHETAPQKEQRSDGDTGLEEETGAFSREHLATAEPGRSDKGALETIPWRDQLGSLNSVDELLKWSLDHEDAGELQISMSGLKRAIQISAGNEDASWVRREEQRLEQRLALRRELTEAIQARESSIEALGVIDVVREGIQFDGSVEPVRWNELRAEDWKALSARVTLTRKARLGLAMEYLSHGREAWADKILERLCQGDPSRAAAVSQVVAWYRDESIPPGGYIYSDGHWKAATVVHSEEALKNAEQLSNRLKSAGKTGRDQVFAKLLALGREDLCREALATRWRAALQRFTKSSGRKDLEKLVKARQEIDEMRRSILDRIQDEYEYPLDLSQPGAAARKRASQDFIDRATQALRARLDSVHPVPIRSGLHAFSDEVQWLLAREQQLGLEESLKPNDVPGWALAVGPQERKLTIETFAWNPADRQGQLRDRAVRKRNAALFERNPSKPAERATSPEEVHLVEITNDYRVLLGQPALAWDPRIQAAAWDHSQYMSRTGDFGHIEKTQGRETSSDRLARREYMHPGGENCAVNIRGADAAHQAWLHSPGHHRNIVAAAHTQIACSNVADYWTQLFGSDTAFLEKLKAWSD